MKVNISSKDLLWGYIGTFMSLTANIIMLPFIVYFLSPDMLGLWYVFSSIGVIATLFDFGFGVTFSRNITYCWSGADTLKQEDVSFVHNKEPDYRLMKNVLSICRRIYLGLSFVALVLLLTVGTSYIHYISRDINNQSYLVAWIVYAIAVFLNLYYGYFSAFLRGVGAIEALNKNTVKSRGMQIILTVVLLVAGAGLVGVCAAYLAYGTLFRILGKHQFFRYRGIGENLKKVTEPLNRETAKSLFRVVWHNAWKDGVIAVSNYFSNGVSTLICSVYLSLTETGIYSLGVQFAMAIATVSSTLYMTYQPVLQSSYINQDRKKTQSAMSVIVTVYVITFAIGLIGTLTVVLPLLRWFKPSSAIPTSIFLGICLYQFLLVFRNCYTSYFSCTNRLPYVKSFVISAVAGVFLSFLFMGPLNLGLWGLICAQITSQAAYNIWYWPLKAHQDMGLPFFALFKIGVGEISGQLRSLASKNLSVK